MNDNQILVIGYIHVAEECTIQFDGFDYVA